MKSAQSLRIEQEQLASRIAGGEIAAADYSFSTKTTSNGRRWVSFMESELRDAAFSVIHDHVVRGRVSRAQMKNLGVPSRVYDAIKSNEPHYVSLSRTFVIAEALGVEKVVRRRIGEVSRAA